MNPEMMKGQIRALLIAAAGLIAGWFGAKGYFSTDQVSAVLNSPVFLSLATIAAGAIWSAMTHTENNAVAVVGKIAARPDSPVKAVITEATDEGKALAQSIPGPTVVAAGTTQAAAAAK